MPPGQVTAHTDAGSDYRTREDRPQPPTPNPQQFSLGLTDPKQRPGSGSLLPSAGEAQTGLWLLHTHHLVSPEQGAQGRSCPSLRHRRHQTQSALRGLAGMAPLGNRGWLQSCWPSSLQVACHSRTPKMGTKGVREELSGARPAPIHLADVPLTFSGLAVNSSPLQCTQGP